LHNLFSVGFLFSNCGARGASFGKKVRLRAGRRESSSSRTAARERTSEEEGGFAFPLLLFLRFFRCRQDGKREEEREQL
jgi:hypothetical protein